MKQPEHMMADECHVDRSPTDEDAKRWATDTLDELNLSHSDAGDFFEGYLDPEGWFRYGTDAAEAISYMLHNDPRRMADALADYIKECR